MAFSNTELWLITPTPASLAFPTLSTFTPHWKGLGGQVTLLPHLLPPEPYPVCKQMISHSEKSFTDQRFLLPSGRESIVKRPDTS